VLNYLGLIPARGGSKGVPGKNIRSLAGKPLIAHTIDAASACERLDRVIVSTDDGEISDVATNHGAEVPFLRPPELAQDDSGAAEVMIHALQGLELEPAETAVVYLQPTSPLRTAADIDNAIAAFESRQADTLVSVTPVPHQYSIESQMIVDHDRLFCTGWSPGVLHRQSKPLRYARNGPAILICRGDNLVAGTGFYDESLTIVPYVMPHERSWDIDAPMDFVVAEALIMQNRGSPEE